MLNLLLRSSLAIFVCLSLSACGVIDTFYLPPAQDTVQEIFEAGNDAILAKEYKKAISYYTKIRDEFPFSPYAVEAELNLGDAYYLRGDYLDAANAYKAFDELHPRNEASPYILYQIGMSLKNSNTSVDRTASEASEAIQYFTRLMQSYPDSPYAQEAPKEILACKKILAERELYIASIFWKMGNAGAAFNRYMYVYQNYPDVPEAYAYAETQAKAAYLKHLEQLSEKERREFEGSWHSLFNWL